jgi:uncharacterized protein YkwD
MAERSLRWKRAASLVAITAAFVLGGCGASGASSASGAGSAGGDPVTEGGGSGSGDPQSTGPAATSAPGDRPEGPLTRKEAERYVLDLVNGDRKKHGLPPVTWNDTAAKAGQRHADDMAQSGYTGHIGTDGSAPEHRHTEAGGTAMVMENAACFADALKRELDPDPRFTIEELERIETTFITEVPPHDGHKRNILTPWHTSLGVALAKTKGLHIVCMAQEFVDDYGQHEPVPRRAKVGSKLKVAGEMRAPAEVAAVGLARVNAPKPRKAEQLLKTSSYAIPAPYVTYFPKGYKTPIPLLVSGRSYSIEIPLSDQGRPGLYGLSVWAKVPSSKDLVMVSLRTIIVD